MGGRGRGGTKDREGWVDAWADGRMDGWTDGRGGKQTARAPSGLRGSSGKRTQNAARLTGLLRGPREGPSPERSPPEGIRLPGSYPPPPPPRAGLPLPFLAQPAPPAPHRKCGLKRSVPPAAVWQVPAGGSGGCLGGARFARGPLTCYFTSLCRGPPLRSGVCDPSWPLRVGGFSEPTHAKPFIGSQAATRGETDGASLPLSLLLSPPGVGDQQVESQRRRVRRGGRSLPAQTPPTPPG